MKYLNYIKDIWKKLNYILNKTQKKWGLFVLFCIMIGAAITVVFI